jgi:hypothetical protein
MSAVLSTKLPQDPQLGCVVAAGAAGTWVCPVPLSGSGVAAASGSAVDCPDSTSPNDNSAEPTNLRRNMAEIVSRSNTATGRGTVTP